MKNIIEIINNSGINLSDYCISTLRRIITDFFSPLGYAYYLSVVLTDDFQIRNINRKFLSKDQETDVIAFSFLNNYPEKIFSVSKLKSKDIYRLKDDLNREAIQPVLQIGESYISVEQAIAYSEINKTSVNKELNWLLLHSLLHLIGYRDNTDRQRNIMFKKAEYFLSSFYNKNKQYNKKKRGKG